MRCFNGDNFFLHRCANCGHEFESYEIPSDVHKFCTYVCLLEFEEKVRKNIRKLSNLFFDQNE